MKSEEDKDGIPDSAVQVDVRTTDSSSAPTDSSSSGSVMVTRDRPLPESEVWFKTYWRPAAAWLYLFINLFDFVIAPVLTMLLPKLEGLAYTPWIPLTLSNGGMFHLAMGAIIGVTAWGRTRERVTGLIQ
jgi:hypothetical protein